MSINNMPFFSVIIPVFNREELVARAIRSVLGQTYENNEIIVVNDGSTDATSKVLNDFQGRISIIETENKGVSSARNIGIEHARGEYIAFLDSDDEWMREKLSRQKNFIEEGFFRIHQTDEIWIRNGKRHNPMLKHAKRNGDFFKESLALCLVSPSAVVIRRDVFEDYGLFDEDMKVCEDYDLWLRVLSKEEIGFLDDKLIIKYGGHEDQLSSSEWGMDRFRIYSMLKLIISGVLSYEKKLFTESEILKKSMILKKGAEKRGNRGLLEGLDRVEQFLSGNSSNTDFSFLLL